MSDKMVQVLIATANLSIIKANTKAKVEAKEATKNTSHFFMQPKSFQNLCSKLRENGYNPYALMYWG
mgnify:FL=1